MYFYMSNLKAFKVRISRIIKTKWVVDPKFDSGPNGGAVSAERSAKSDYSLGWYNPLGPLKIF